MTEECCDTPLKEIFTFSDDELCSQCVVRIEDYLDDMALDRASEEYYEQKYGRDD